jgi:6-phosphogluconate dehydrogenase
VDIDRGDRRRHPNPVLTSALYSRFASMNLDDFANKTLSAMRKGFGGHDEKKD